LELGKGNKNLFTKAEEFDILFKRLHERKAHSKKKEVDNKELT